MRWNTYGSQHLMWDQFLKWCDLYTFYLIKDVSVKIIIYYISVDNVSHESN